MREVGGVAAKLLGKLWRTLQQLKNNFEKGQHLALCRQILSFSIQPIFEQEVVNLLGCFEVGGS